MLRRLCYLAPLAVFLLTQTGCMLYPYRAEIESRETASVDGLNKLAVETNNGHITVRCDSAAKDVSIHTIRRAGGLSDEDARQFAEKIEIQIDRGTTEPGVLRVAAKMPPQSMNRSPSAAFEIVMPPSAEITIHSSNGRVSAEGCEKKVDAETSNGDIKLAACKADVCGHTSNGEIDARDISGDVDVQTSNGDIELARVGKASIRAVSTNGRIRVVDSCGAAKVRSSNGSVTLQCRSLPETGDVEVVTSNGRVDVEIPSSVKADLSMSTSNGHVRADLHGAQVNEMESHRSHLRAKLNGGGNRVDLQSSNGSVVVRTRATSEAAQGTR